MSHTPTKAAAKKKGGLFAADTLQRPSQVSSTQQQERAKALFAWRRFVAWAVSCHVGAIAGSAKPEEDWAQWMAAQDETVLRRERGLSWKPGGRVTAPAVVAASEVTTQQLRSGCERSGASLASFMAARVSAVPSPGVHVELRPVQGSLALFVSTLACHLGATEVSVSVIPPSNRPVINVPTSQPWPLESEVFEMLLWFRLYLSPAKLFEYLSEQMDAWSKDVVRQRGVVRLVLVWFLKSGAMGESEALQTQMTELLSRQQFEPGQHDYKKLAQQLRNGRDGAVQHSEALKRTQGSFSQHLTVRFISMTKVGKSDHFALLEEVGPETVSKVLLLRGCAMFARLYPSHLAQRVHCLLWGAGGWAAAAAASSGDEFDAHPLLPLVAHHAAVAVWAAGVALQSRETFATNVGNLVALAKTAHKRGDAFTAAAVLQGLSHPSIVRVRVSLSFKTDKRLAKLRTRMAPTAVFGEPNMTTLPIALLLENAVFAETSHGIPASVEALDFDVLRQVARSHESLLLCADRSRSVIVTNGGPNLSSDKSLVLSDWVASLAAHNLTEEELMMRSNAVQSQMDLTDLLAKGSFTPRHSPRASPRTPRKK